MGRIFRVALVAAGCVVASWPAQSQTASSTAGKDAYDVNCASCHGHGGRLGSTGKSVGASDLRSAKVQALSDVKIRQRIIEGKGTMPPFPGLSPEEVNSLVKYIRTLKAKPVTK
jgi:mono/diheme cytochrome c family protein